GRTERASRPSGCTSCPPPPKGGFLSVLLLRQNVLDDASEDRAVGRVYDGQGLEAQRVERVAKHVNSVVVVAEREVLRPNLGVRAAQVDLAAVADVDVAEVVHGRHRDLEADSLRHAGRAADEKVSYRPGRDQDR